MLKNISFRFLLERNKSIDKPIDRSNTQIIEWEICIYNKSEKGAVRVHYTVVDSLASTDGTAFR